MAFLEMHVVICCLKKIISQTYMDIQTVFNYAVMSCQRGFYLSSRAILNDIVLTRKHHACVFYLSFLPGLTTSGHVYFPIKYHSRCVPETLRNSKHRERIKMSRFCLASHRIFSHFMHYNSKNMNFTFAYICNNKIILFVCY